jgi:predicted dehydrogenase
MARETGALNWGLLSTARINRAVIPPLRASKRNRLLAVASRTRETAEAYAREWNIPRAHASYEALLSDPEIDVVYNSLPNHLHAEWTIRAVEAGKHVLCEKPLALDVSEVDAIRRAATKHGRAVAEAFMYRHHPLTLRAQELVMSGALGALMLIRGSFSFVLSREDDIRWRPEFGGGSLRDIGCYPVSYARTMAGADPVEVYGAGVSSRTGVDVTFCGQMQFAGGLLAQFDCSFAAPYRTFMEVVGTEAILEAPYPFKPGLDAHMILRRGERAETITAPGQELYSGEVEDMADVILEGRSPRVPLSDSRANVAVLAALLESARVNKPIRPPGKL